MTPEQDSHDFKVTDPRIMKEIALHCFLHLKLKLKRNWGQVNEFNQLEFSLVTMLQFVTNSCNCQVLIEPNKRTVHLMHCRKRGRKLYLELHKTFQRMIQA